MKFLVFRASPFLVLWERAGVEIAALDTDWESVRRRRQYLCTFANSALWWVFSSSEVSGFDPIQWRWEVAGPRFLSHRGAGGVTLALALAPGFAPEGRSRYSM